MIQLSTANQVEPSLSKVKELVLENGYGPSLVKQLEQRAIKKKVNMSTNSNDNNNNNSDNSKNQQRRIIIIKSQPSRF